MPIIISLHHRYNNSCEISLRSQTVPRLKIHPQRLKFIEVQSSWPVVSQTSYRVLFRIPFIILSFYLLRPQVVLLRASSLSFLWVHVAPVRDSCICLFHLIRGVHLMLHLSVFDGKFSALSAESLGSNFMFDHQAYQVCLWVLQLLLKLIAAQNSIYSS